MAKTARLEARVPSDLYEAAKRAAHLEGPLMTHFVIDSVRKVVERSAQQTGMIRLSAEDQSRFISVLMDSSQPNQALLAAARKHCEQFDDDSDEGRSFFDKNQGGIDLGPGMAR